MIRHLLLIGSAIAALGVASGARAELATARLLVRDFVVAPGDLNAAPIACYGNRRLRAAFAGQPMVGYRSSDAAQIPIPFDARGNLSTAVSFNFMAKSAIVLASQADQCGSSTVATNSLPGRSPSLVSKGAHATVFYNGGGLTNQTAAANSTINGLFTGGGLASSVFTITGAPTTQAMVWMKLNVVIFSFPTASSLTMSLTQAATGGGSWVTTAVTTGVHIGEVQYNSSALSNVPVITVDGAAKALTSTQPTGTITTDNVALDLGGSTAVGNHSLPGEVDEVFFWKSPTITTGGLIALRANQKCYWRTP
jgi:hypothetical protein